MLFSPTINNKYTTHDISETEGDMHNTCKEHA